MNINKQAIENSIEDLKHYIDCFISTGSMHDYDSMESAFNHARNMINKYSNHYDRKQYMTIYTDLYCGEDKSPFFTNTDSYTVGMVDSDNICRGQYRNYRGVDSLHAIFQFIRDIRDGEYQPGEYIIHAFNESDFRSKPITI